MAEICPLSLSRVLEVDNPLSLESSSLLPDEFCYLYPSCCRVDPVPYCAGCGPVLQPEAST